MAQVTRVKAKIVLNEKTAQTRKNRRSMGGFAQNFLCALRRINGVRCEKMVLVEDKRMLAKPNWQLHIRVIGWGNFVFGKS